MPRDLSVLLDQLGPDKTVEDRMRLVNETSEEDTFDFNLEVHEIKPWTWFAGNEKSRGGKTVLGKLKDGRSKKDFECIEHTYDQSGQGIQLAVPKKWNYIVSDWESRQVVSCSGQLLGWDATNERYQLLATEIQGSWDSLLLGVAWILKMLFSPVWIPCWLAYKFAYIGIALGLGIGVIGMATDNMNLATLGWAASFGFGAIGLVLRLYVWAFKIRWLADTDQESEE